MTYPITPSAGWDQLLQLEPGLSALEQATVLSEARLPADFCANVYWSRVVKPLMRDLVGWSRSMRRPPNDGPVADLLRSQWAYDVATRHLYERLPACRSCGCPRFGSAA